MKKLALCGVAVGLLAGCAAGQNSVVAGLESGYIAAESAELVYEQSGHATAGTIRQIETDRLAAEQLISPLVATAEAGGSVTTTAELEAAQAALTTLTNFLIANGVTPTGASS